LESVAKFQRSAIGEPAIADLDVYGDGSGVTIIGLATGSTSVTLITDRSGLFFNCAVVVE
jgi:hypothetical protein